MVVETEIGESAGAPQHGAGVAGDVGEAGERHRNERRYGVYASGDRFAVAAQWLTRADFDAVPVAGGMQAWGRSGRRPRVPERTEQKL